MTLHIQFDCCVWEKCFVIIVNFNLSPFLAVTGGQRRKKGFVISDRNRILFSRTSEVSDSFTLVNRSRMLSCSSCRILCFTLFYWKGILANKPF